jgi:tetratricopeptide (TPR) repeat protein
MRRIQPSAPGAPFAGLVASLLPLAAFSAPGPQLEDVAARIDYGYYAGDRAVLAAARDGLQDQSDDDAWVLYYRAYAAFRLAALEHHHGGPAGALLDDCIDSAEAATKTLVPSVEAWVLVAACSELAAAGEPLRSVLHQRRVEQALRAGRADQPDNPRLKLVEAWHSADGDAGLASADTKTLEAALAAFDSRDDPFAMPNWGEAEVLTALADVHLGRGDVRQARDYVERALLLAPDFSAALAVRARLLAH